MFAKIYQPSKNAMQSSKAKSNHWVLEFQQEIARRTDPLMGWTGSSDMQSDQVKLKFDSLDAAVNYAKDHNLPYQVQEKKRGDRVAKSYADNFASNRRMPWTH